MALSVVATAVVAVAFQPVRERVQRVANRLVYGARATPYEVLSDFADRMAGHVHDRGAAAPDGADRRGVPGWCAGRGLAAQRSASWSARSAGRRSRPRTAGARSPIVGEAVPALDGDRAVPVRHHEELLGLLTVTKPPGEPVTPAEDALLGPRRLAGRAGAAQRAADRRPAQLARAAGHHPGRRAASARAQPARRRAAEPGLGRAAAADGGRLADPTTAARAALDGGVRRSCSRRSRSCASWPAASTRRSSPNAGSARHSPRWPSARRCRCTWTTSVDQRLPAAVEGTLYFVVAEALTNVARYARRRRSFVVVDRRGRRR